jgi:NAD-dependent dihydropyrimidine dehydrogenase PreA subunit
MIFDDVGTPGSPKAIKNGCICAIMDNRYGEGFRYNTMEPHFWITGGCPVHSAGHTFVPAYEDMCMDCRSRRPEADENGVSYSCCEEVCPYLEEWESESV